MKIRMGDGRVLQGTAHQIVGAMKDIAFGVDGMTLSEFIDHSVDNLRHLQGPELSITGETEQERAASLVSEMLRVGLAVKM
jgi:hypothetical protein